MSGISEKRSSGRRVLWFSGIGGFVLGALTVIIVLALARRTGDRDEVGKDARPASQAVPSER